ncbi:MAG TPA: putative metal-binding motif-containing protein, partial [Candidatus Cloacimonadota bacterium]|nr:putative metal-binding motif-containing protein [Candidatus Cloacimonadota bacterium]
MIRSLPSWLGICYNGQNTKYGKYININPDDPDESDFITWYRDKDEDTWGDEDHPVEGLCRSCPPPPGMFTVNYEYADRSGDCNDNNAEIKPTAEERCDETDWNCNSDPYEDLRDYFCIDNDGDGFGVECGYYCAGAEPENYTLFDESAEEDCNDDNKKINPNTVWCYDPDGDMVCDEPGNTKTQCSKPANYSATYLMQYPSRVDNCPDVSNPLVRNPSPYRELFAARYDENALEGGSEDLKKGAALLGFGYFTGDRKYFVWQPDHDLDGIGDACDFENSEGEGGFFYSRIYDVKAKPVFSGLVDSYATVKVSMPKDSGKGSESCSGFDSPRCDVAVHYCAMGHEDAVTENLWGRDGYCTTTEKTDNTVYSDEFTCNFGFSHGSDYTSESVERWRKRISQKWYSFDSVGNYLGSEEIDPNEDPGRKPVYAFEWQKAHEWNWRRDWYGDNLCYHDDYRDTPICQSLRRAGNYNETFTMYYSVSSSVAADEDAEFVIVDGATKKINPEYFHSSNVFSRAFRYGKGGDNTGMMSLNFFNLVPGRLIPWEELMRILRFIKYDGYSNIYLTAPLNLVVDGAALKPDAMKNYSGRWSVNKQDGAYQLNSQKIYFSDSAGNFIIGEGLNKSIYAVNEAVNSQGETVYELRINSEDNGADWNKIGTVGNWDTDIRAIKTVIEKDNALYLIAKVGLANDLWTLIMIMPPSLAPLGTFACDEPVPVYTVNEIQQSGINDTDFDDLKLISVNDSVFLVGSDDTDGSIRMFEMNENNVFTE